MDDINFIKSNIPKHVKKPLLKTESNVGWSKPEVEKKEIKPDQTAQPNKNTFVNLQTNRPARKGFFESLSQKLFGQTGDEIKLKKNFPPSVPAPVIPNTGHNEVNYRQELKKEIEKRISQKDIGLNKITPPETEILHLSVKPGIFDQLTKFLHSKDQKSPEMLRAKNDYNSVNVIREKGNVPSPAIIAKEDIGDKEKNKIISARSSNLLNPSKFNNLSADKTRPEAASKKWENPKIVETNLLADELNIYGYKGEIITAVLFFFLSGILVASLYGLLIFWQKDKEAKNSTEQKRMADIDNQIKEAREGIVEINNFKDKLKPVTAILDSHIYWTNWFDFLENNLIKGSNISSFSGDTSGSYKLKVTVDSYSQVGESLNVFYQNSLVKKAETNEGHMRKSGLDSNKVDFELDLEIDPSIFTKTAE
jgi:hypothetical protein